MCYGRVRVSEASKFFLTSWEIDKLKFFIELINNFVDLSGLRSRKV